MRVIVATLLCVLLSAVAQSASAEDQPSLPPVEQGMAPSAGAALRACDGFGGVSAGGDDIIRPQRSMDTLGRVEPSFEHSVQYCDRALLVLDAYPQYWLRRVSVLQSRALHRIIANDTTGALADLDAADALVHQPVDADYSRSLGVNGQLIRALALQLQGRDAQAAALSASAISQRPYNRPVLIAALIILGPDAPREQMLPLLVQLARLDPRWASMYDRYLVGARLPPRDLHAFFMLMLEAEAPNRVSHGWEAPSTSQVVECYQVQSPRAGARSFDVCAASENDTPAMTEERALLDAAQKTIALHAASFVIERRRDTATSWTDPYSRQQTQGGYVSIVSVRVLDDSAECGHCLNANDIVQTLAPRYAQQLADQEAARLRRSRPHHPGDNIPPPRH
ncbi:MAG: hypothetical protein HY054_01640 [Proteobacteria bacterium]|nr:hypothetical protein [Pseudomonadota bacterium]